MPAMPETAKVSATLGLPAGVRTPADLDRVVREGLPYRSLTRVARRFPERQRAAILQIVAPRQTLQRREQEGRLKPEESERLERIARLSTLAQEVWGSEAQAQRFLTTPHRLLGGRTPLDLAATDLGARRVEDLLWGLEYSLPV
jgi:putative toxin-antitoxin system antitoxin component (TIGR02293 family)